MGGWVWAEGGCFADQQHEDVEDDLRGGRGRGGEGLGASCEAQYMVAPGWRFSPDSAYLYNPNPHPNPQTSPQNTAPNP